MRRAAKVWPTEDTFLQHGVGEMPWDHVTVLLDRLETREDRDWYAGRAVTELRYPSHQAPTIGVVLCTGKNEAIVRYTLANMSAALGVADYEGLPADARAALPPAQELEAVVADELARHRAQVDSDAELRQKENPNA